MARSIHQQEKYNRGIKLRADGATIKEVARRCDVAYNTARAWFNERFRQRQRRYVREWRERNENH